MNLSLFGDGILNAKQDCEENRNFYTSFNFRFKI